MLSNWFKARVNLIPQKYSFCDHSICRQIKQSTLGLNRGLSSHFGWSRSANHVKFTEECVIYTVKSVLVKIMFLDLLNMGFALRASVEKITCGVETHWISGKENVPGAVVSKEGNADGLLGHERTHHYWFPSNRCNWKLFPFAISFCKIQLIYRMTLVFAFSIQMSEFQSFTSFFPKNARQILAISSYLII